MAAFAHIHASPLPPAAAGAAHMPAGEARRMAQIPPGRRHRVLSAGRAGMRARVQLRTQGDRLALGRYVNLQ